MNFCWLLIIDCKVLEIDDEYWGAKDDGKGIYSEWEETMQMIIFFDFKIWNSTHVAAHCAKKLTMIAENGENNQ